MNDRVLVKSQRERLLANIFGLCRASSEQKQLRGGSTTLEASIVELVRETMREIARNEPENSGKEDLLSSAIAETENAILQELGGSGIKCNLSPFFQVAKKELKQTAIELSDLSKRLFESRRDKRVKEQLIDLSDLEKSFSIHQIGLEGFPTGLLARPADHQTLELDFNALRTRIPCEIAGEAFPIEVMCKRYVFVVDDDGAVFVSVDGLPVDEVHDVEELLQHIAQALYV